MHTHAHTWPILKRKTNLKEADSKDDSEAGMSSKDFKEDIKKNLFVINEKIGNIDRNKNCKK